MREARAVRFPLGSDGGYGSGGTASGGRPGGAPASGANFDDAPIPIEGDEGPRRVIRPTSVAPLGTSIGVAGGASEDAGVEAGAPLSPVGTPVAPGSKIRSFDQGLLGKRHEDEWSRTPNTTGTGAIHCKSFHCKLNEEGLLHLDAQINEWLDAHPQYEVKLVHSSIGEWQTKTSREPNLIVQVWV
ncbi:MAG: hypothetical protein RBS39_13305 [Phycisphaerales bacterium]|nr:hypothetical protein [Phycisphaerales bacterium]